MPFRVPKNFCEARDVDLRNNRLPDIVPHFMSRLEGKLLVAQGGGPTAVINQSIVGVTLEARKFSQVKAVYGAMHGVRGIIDEDFIDLTR